MAWWKNFTKKMSVIKQSDNQINEVLTKLKHSTKGLACCLSKILPRTQKELEALGYRIEVYSDFFFVYNYGLNCDKQITEDELRYELIKYTHWLWKQKFAEMMQTIGIDKIVDKYLIVLKK